MGKLKAIELSLRQRGEEIDYLLSRYIKDAERAYPRPIDSKNITL